MKIRTWWYFFQVAVRSLRRNLAMSLASVGTVAVSLMILGASLLLVVNTNYIAATLESNVEINCYLQGNISQEDVKEIGSKIKSISGVAEVEFISKEQGLEILRGQLGNRDDILEALGGKNPLPDRYRVKVTIPEEIAGIAGQIEKLKGIETVKYGQGVVEKLFTLTNWVRWGGTVVMIALALAAVFLIATTIRLTVFARQQEITIMKFVGATDWFIRWPFFIEGMFLGLIGGLVAVVVLFASYTTFTGYVSDLLAFVPLVMDQEFLFRLSGGLLITGGLLGAVGSSISLRRFLKV